MGKHDDHRTRHLEKEDKYSLQELKERARQEVNFSRNHRTDGKGRERFSRRKSRSRSPRNHHRYKSDEQLPFREKWKSPEKNEHLKKPEEKVDIKPNFELTGNLSKDTNTFNGVVVKYNEPPEAKKPGKHWRFYPFKGDTPLDFIPLHTQSAYLFGRDRRVCDIPIDHPSCSKQHAALQFRSIQIDREDGTKVRVTRPYIIDLESANGTFVNHKQVEARRYVELFEKDVVKFGFSTREYVLLHDQSQGELKEESDADT